MTVLIIEKDFTSKRSPPYLKEFVTFYDTWLMHKYIGGGIKTLGTIVTKDQTSEKIQSLFVICIRTTII